MSSGSEVVPKGKRMVYPYTISAKIAQFPYQLYMRHWMYRYLAFGILGSYPVFLWIHSKGWRWYTINSAWFNFKANNISLRIVNSPAAKAVHAERLRKEGIFH